MKSNSFLLALIFTCTITGLQCGQVGSRPIQDPLDLLMTQSRQEQGRRYQQVRQTLQKTKPGSFSHISDDSSVDEFYKGGVPAPQHSLTQESSLSPQMTKTPVVAQIIPQTMTIVLLCPTKKNKWPIRSDIFLGSEEDDEDSLESLYSEQQKRQRTNDQDDFSQSSDSEPSESMNASPTLAQKQLITVEE